MRRVLLSEVFTPMKYFFVYMLRCVDGSFYAGHTDNIEKRISEHEQGAYCCYTRSRLPVTVVFLQTFTSRDAAFAAERQIKGWSRAKKEALIKKDWNKISILAQRTAKEAP